jgi:membrane-associated HD superfamily phosphohydrolase
VASFDIKAPFSFEIIDDKKTKIMMERAANEVEPVYRYDNNIYLMIQNSSDSIYNVLEKVLGETSEISLENIEKKISQNLYFVPQKQINSLAKHIYTLKKYTLT